MPCNKSPVPSITDGAIEHQHCDFCSPLNDCTSINRQDAASVVALQSTRTDSLQHHQAAVAMVPVVAVLAFLLYEQRLPTLICSCMEFRCHCSHLSLPRRYNPINGSIKLLVAVVPPVLLFPFASRHF
jgi:hypothetical protein